MNKITKFTSLLILVLSFSLYSNAQQVIGLFPAVGGGFEPFSTITLGTSTSTTTWFQNSGGTSGTITTSSTQGSARTGTKFLSIPAQTSTGKYPVSPNTLSLTGSTTYVLQFYYRTATATTYFNVANYADKNLGALSLSNTSGGWLKGFGKFSTNATPTASLSVGFKLVTAGVPLTDFDDIVLYPGTALDETAPNAPTNVTIASSTATTATINWTGDEKSGDDGGYIIVKSTSSNPVTLNANGIYQVNNTSSDGTGVIAAITPGVSGTAQSYTLTGLTEGTTYYFTVFACDKAFNYSNGVVAIVSSTPYIAFTSGTNPATVMETSTLTPAVFTYSNITDDANVLYDWYTDATYTTTTTAPSGLSITKNTGAKTVTVSGTPALATAGTYYYKITANESGGNSFQGSVVVTSYVTPTPTISLTSGSSTQIWKAGSTIQNIIYSLTNSTGATVEGLPAGISGLFVSTGANTGNYTISGTVEALATIAANTYTVKATPMSGYTGSDITSTGTITVADPAKKLIAYILNTGVSTTDTRIKPYLETNHTLNTILIANVNITTNFSAYDLVILTESPSSGSTGMKALWGINKPLICFKMFAIQANTWNLSTATNPSPAVTGITVVQNTHPIFDGITRTGTNSDEIQLLGAITTGNGVQTSPYSSSYNLANIIGATTPAIIEFPVGTTSPLATGTATNSVSQAKAMIISIANDNQDKVTNDGLTLIQNAINYLTGSSTWTPTTTGLHNILTGITFDGQTIHNNNHQMITVFDATGRLVVTSNKNVNMNGYAKGIYMIRGEKGQLKIAYTK